MRLMVQIVPDVRNRQCNMTVAGTIAGLIIEGSCYIIS